MRRLRKDLFFEKKKQKTFGFGMVLVGPMWGASFDQVSEGRPVLINYDAKAVADVTGIAFVGGPARVPSAAGRKFIIDVGESSVQIVNAGANEDKTPRGSHRGSSPRRDLERPSSPTLIEKAVENGLPRLSLRHLVEHFAGGDPSKVASLEWVLVPKTTLKRRADQLSPKESKRAERVARLLVHARRALRTAEGARNS